MPKTKKTVKISRKHWCRGGNTDAALKTKTGQSCCLGFVARAYGLKTPVGTTELCDLEPKDFSKLPAALRPDVYRDPFFDRMYFDNTSLHNDLVAVNDDPDLKPSERELEVKRLLAMADIKVIFKD